MIQFKENSVIDYVIASSDCLKYMSRFEIKDTDLLYSDGHSILHFELGSALLPNLESQTGRRPNYPRWQEEKILDFVNNVDRSHLQAISDQLNTYPQSQSTIENITNDIALLFKNAINITFPTTASEVRPTQNNNKPWFGSDCNRARKKYNRAKHKYKVSRTDYNKSMLNKASKQYKNTINFHVNNYRHNKAKKLRSMATKRPKHYCKFLNGLKRKAQDNNGPTLNEFYDYYKNINNNDAGVSQSTDLPQFNQSDLESNSPILLPEIEKCILNLNNGKSSSPIDDIINEYLKYSKELLLPLLTKLFNCVFDTGFVPVSWVKGVIIPVYKNKGDQNQVQNYWPITILHVSCLGKLFTSVLNKRLTKYLESNNLLNQNQAGIRSGNSCQDHIFTLHSLIEILKARNKKVFCAYVDFSSAFDTVNRASLWQKILAHNINGKISQVIYNMCSNIRSCVSLHGTFSAIFNFEKGVRQGENLSPILFSLFLNDMQKCIKSKGGLGIELTDDQNILWLKLLVLLYADDTVILSDNKHDFQISLNAFHSY